MKDIAKIRLSFPSIGIFSQYCVMFITKTSSILSWRLIVQSIICFYNPKYRHFDIEKSLIPICSNLDPFLENNHEFHKNTSKYMCCECKNGPMNMCSFCYEAYKFALRMVKF